MASWLRCLVATICALVHASSTYGCQKDSKASTERTCQPTHLSDMKADLENDWEDTSMLARSRHLLKDKSKSRETISETIGSAERQRHGIVLQIGVETKSKARSDKEKFPDSVNDGIASRRIDLTESNQTTPAASWPAAMLTQIGRSRQYAVEHASMTLSNRSLSVWMWGFVFVVALLILVYVCYDMLSDDRGETKCVATGSPPKSLASLHYNGHISPPRQFERVPSFSTPKGQERGQFSKAGVASPNGQSLSPTSSKNFQHPLSSMAVNLDDIPPPLCKALVLHDAVTCVAISKLQLQRAADPSLSVEGVEFDIDGTRQKSLFRVTVLPNPDGGKALGISLPWNGVVPWAVLRATPNAGAAGLTFDIINRDKMHYGELTLVDNLHSTVVHNSMKKFDIFRDRETESITATSTSGIVMASLEAVASDRADFLELRVKSGVCPLLALSCVLGVLTLTT